MTDYVTAVKQSKVFPDIAAIDSVEFLIPDPSMAWDVKACGLPAAPANCVAERASRAVICNPAMARLLTDVSLGVGSSSQEHLLASRFLAYVIVGHELAHFAHPTQALALADALPRATGPIVRSDSLKCPRQPGNAADEEACDRMAIRAACEALRTLGTQHGLRLTADPGTVLRQVSALEQRFDFDYFRADDVCIGDVTHPSALRRRLTFGKELLTCLYRSALEADAVGPVVNLELQSQLATVADEFAALLARDQDRGYPATPTYGVARISHVRSVAGLGGTLSYVDEDANSVLYRSVERSGTPQPDMVHHLELLRFEHHATLEFLRATPEQATIVTSRSDAGKKIVELHRVECHDDQCRVDVVGKAVVPGHETAVAVDTGVTSVGDRQVSIRSFVQQGQRPSVRTWRRTQPPESEPPIIAANDRSVWVQSLSKFGLYIGDFIDTNSGGASARMINLDFGADEKGTTRAAAFIGDRFYSVLERDGRAPSWVVWDCPVSLLKTPGDTDCLIWNGPQGALDMAPALLRSDIEALRVSILDADPSCGKGAVAEVRGISWLLNEGWHTTLPATGVVACDFGGGAVRTFRAGRIDWLRLDTTIGETPIHRRIMSKRLK